MENYIIKSKERCRERGLDPNSIPTLEVFDPNVLDIILNDYQEILSVVNFFVNKVLLTMNGTPIVMFVTDANGTILEYTGDETVKSMMQQLGFRPGVRFTEECNGTNAVSLALRHKCPIKLVGMDHYHEFVRRSACFTIPFRNDLGTILGTITIMTSSEQSHDLFITLLGTVVDSVERELLLRQQNKKLKLLNQIISDTTRIGIVLTDVDGRITEFNNYAEKLTRLSRINLLGKPVQELKYLGNFIAQILTTCEKKEDTEFVIEDSENSVKTVCLFNGMPVYDERNGLIGALGKFHDATDAI
jgi:PAS domain S-box-containing protein